MEFAARDVSMVIPVKDNEPGVERLFHHLWNSAMLEGPAGLPAEIVVVDNNSHVPVRLPWVPPALRTVCTVRMIRCREAGPAAARNAGAAASTKPWIHFVDSDCIPTHGFVSGFGNAMDGSVAYAGSVRALGTDALSRYYETQRILEPPANASGRPQYLVTANALVWREAFERIGGFREDFKLPAGEDVDLALRLVQVGTIAFATRALVLHDFEPTPQSFWARFVRYGVGNHQVERLHGLDLTPRPFPPNEESVFNWLAASVQYFAMAKGYRAARLIDSAR
jgi:GT2 family glycosyltransferase